MRGCRENWVRVSRRQPCPICGKPDNCNISRDGVMVWCGRIDTGSIRQNSGGQFLHRLGHSNHILPPLPPRRVSLKPGRDWKAFAQQMAVDGSQRLAELASLLGVPEEALTRLGVGWNAAEQYWSFPEKDAEGRVIGINSRDLNGDKKRLYGGHAGLTYVPDWDTGQGPALLVEGGSDTAALLSLGCTVIGRPSNCGGVDLLVELLFDFPGNRDVIVIGERDQKPNGLWPGRDGAIRTAQGLAEGLERSILWAFPPDDAKDARDWLRSAPAIPAERLRNLFISGLDTTVSPPPVVVRHIPSTMPVMAVAEWRRQMLDTRLQSLFHPGIYLDRSATGAGKSHVDFNAIMAGRQEVSA